jgi:hypothetical protein
MVRPDLMATLLQSVCQIDGDPDEVEHAVREQLRTGALILTGTFRGHEQDIIETGTITPGHRGSRHPLPTT